MATLTYRDIQANNKANLASFSKQWQARLKDWGYRNGGKRSVVEYSSYLLDKAGNKELGDHESVVSKFQDKIVGMLIGRFIEFGEILSFTLSNVCDTDIIPELEMLSIQFVSWYESKWGAKPMTRESFYSSIGIEENAPKEVVKEVPGKLPADIQQLIEGLQAEVDSLTTQNKELEAKMFAAIREAAIAKDDLDTVKEEMSEANDTIDSMTEELVKFKQANEAINEKLEELEKAETVTPQATEETEVITSVEQFEDFLEDLFMGEGLDEITMPQLILDHSEKFPNSSFLPMVSKLNKSGNKFAAVNDRISWRKKADLDGFTKAATEAISDTFTGKLQWAQLLIKLQDNYSPSLKWDQMQFQVKQSPAFKTYRGYVSLA